MIGPNAKTVFTQSNCGCIIFAEMNTVPIDQTLPGAMPHRSPQTQDQQRLLTISPYVREAQETVRPAWHLKSRRLLDYLLINVLSGTGEFTIAGQTMPIVGGELIWIPPGITHEMQGNSPGMHLQFIHFDLCYDPARSHWSARIPGGTNDLAAWQNLRHPSLSDPEISRWCGRLPTHNRTRISEIMRRIILEYSQNEISGLLIAGLMLQLIDHLLEPPRGGGNSPAFHTKAIEQAKEYIQFNCQENLSIPDIARQCNLSTSHFRKLFQEHYQQSPRDIYINAKIRLACDYLSYTQMTVSEIALKLGFSTIHNFSRSFRNVIGNSPIAYRSGQKASAELLDKTGPIHS